MATEAHDDAAGLVVLVVKLGGNVVADADALDAVAAAITEALQADAPAAITLVHGGGPQLDAALAALGEPTVRHEGLRVTSPAAAAIVQDQLDRVGAELAASLTRRGVPAEHVPSTLGLFEARIKRLASGHDLQRVGSVERFHGERLAEARGTASVRVITPVGVDGAGPLNVNADEGALAVAQGLAADWLVLATDVGHVLDADGEPVTVVGPKGVERLLASGAIKGGMVPKLRAAVDALEGGVGHVLIGRMDEHTLAACLTGGPVVGTVITTSAGAGARTRTVGP